MGILGIRLHLRSRLYISDDEGLLDFVMLHSMDLGGYQYIGFIVVIIPGT